MPLPVWLTFALNLDFFKMYLKTFFDSKQQVNSKKLFKINDLQKFCRASKMMKKSPPKMRSKI